MLDNFIKCDVHFHSAVLRSFSSPPTQGADKGIGLKPAATERCSLIHISLLAEQAGTAPPGGNAGKQEGLCEQILT